LGGGGAEHRREFGRFSVATRLDDGSVHSVMRLRADGSRETGQSDEAFLLRAAKFQLHFGHSRSMEISMDMGSRSAADATFDRRVISSTGLSYSGASVDGSELRRKYTGLKCAF